MTAPTAHAAELSAVTLSRGGRVVLHDVSATMVADGVTTVVGASGAGKSSVLRCLNRLEEPEAGRVLVDGRDVREQDPLALRRLVGLVAQSPVMLPGTVDDNLAVGMDAAGGPGWATRRQAALERAGLPAAFAAREARTVSGGEAMRVAIARALVREPRLLVLDEPTAALDRPVARALEEELRQLSRDRTAVVLVTHDEGLAARLATHVVRLDAGRVTAAGPPSAVLR